MICHSGNVWQTIEQVTFRDDENDDDRKLAAVPKSTDILNFEETNVEKDQDKKMS